MNTVYEAILSRRSIKSYTDEQVPQELLEKVIEAGRYAPTGMNAMAPILVQLTLRIGTSILHVAGLSYIGLGVQPPAPEWGAILTAAKVYMRDAWHISVFPGLFLVITVVAFNLFGDGLRDALDPKLKR